MIEISSLITLLISFFELDFITNEWPLISITVPRFVARCAELSYMTQTDNGHIHVSDM